MKIKCKDGTWQSCSCLCNQPETLTPGEESQVTQAKALIDLADKVNTLEGK